MMLPTSIAGISPGNMAAAVKQRSKRKRGDREAKSVASFRAALYHHVERNARFSAAPPKRPIENINDVPTVSEDQRMTWLARFRERIQHMDVQALVRESIKYRFQCDPYVIIIPNWHALREALWDYLKKNGIKKAKRSVSTKQDLVQICIQPEVKVSTAEWCCSVMQCLWPVATAGAAWVVCQLCLLPVSVLCVLCMHIL